MKSMNKTAKRILSFIMATTIVLSTFVTLGIASEDAAPEGESYGYSDSDADESGEATGDSGAPLGRSARPFSMSVTDYFNVILSVPDTYQSYDIPGGASAPPLSIKVSVQTKNEDTLTDAKIRLPVAPLSPDGTAYFTYSGASSIAGSINIESIEVVGGEVVITLKNPVQTNALDEIYLDYEFDPQYKGKVPPGIVIWETPSAILELDGEEETVTSGSGGSGSGLASNAQDKRYAAIIPQFPTGTSRTSKQAYNPTPVQVPLGTTNITVNLRNYFTDGHQIEMNPGFVPVARLYLPEGALTSDTSYLPAANPNPGDSRVCRELQISAVPSYSGNTNNVVGFSVPSATTEGDTFEIELEFTYQLVGESTPRMESVRLPYKVIAAKGWDFYLLNNVGYHGTGDSQIQTCGLEDGDVSSPSAYAGFSTYGNSFTTKNISNTALDGVSVLLKQISANKPGVGAVPYAKLNFNFVRIYIVKENAETPKRSRIQYVLTFKDISGNITRTKTSPIVTMLADYCLISGDELKPDSDSGEYLDSIQVYPVSADDDAKIGTLEGKNSIGIMYSFKAWPGKQWPGGTPIDSDGAQIIMGMQTYYNDENGNPNVAPKSDYLLHRSYYCEGPDPEAIFTTTAGAVAPGDSVAYNLKLYNYTNNSSLSWKNPVVAFKSPQYLTVQSADIGGTPVDVTPVGEPSGNRQNYIMTLPGRTLARSNSLGLTVNVVFKAQNGAPSGTYSFDRPLLGSLDGSIYSSVLASAWTPTYSPPDGETAADYGMDAYGNFIRRNTLTHTPVTIRSSAQVISKSEVRTTPTGSWINEAINIPTEQGQTPQVKLTIQNTGNIAVNGLRMLNVIPQVTGTTFAGITDATGWTVYYTTGTPPAANANPADITDLSGWTQGNPTSDATAILLVYGDLPIGGSASAILNFNITGEDTTLTNQYTYSYTASGTPYQFYSKPHGFATDGLLLSFDPNTTDVTLANFPDPDVVTIDPVAAGTRSIVIPGNVPTRTGYTFQYWLNGGASYNPGDTVTFGASEKSITLYAHWIPRSDIKVIFDKNGGTTEANPNEKLYTFGTTLASGDLPTPPSRNGYIFGGWSTVRNSSEDFGVGTVINFVNAKTVYAIWTPKSLLLPDNFSKVSGSAAKTYIPGTSTSYAISFTLPNNVDAYKSIRIEDIYDADNLSNPAIVSLTIDGSAVGSLPSLDTSVAGKASVTLNSADFSADDEIILTLSFNVISTASGTISNTAKLYVTNWDNNETDPGVGGTEIINIVKHNITYRYTGTVPAGAPAVPAGETDVPYGTTGKTVATKPTMTGYTLSDWTTPNATVTGGTFTMPDNDVEFTATWVQNKYTVTFDSQGGSAVSPIENIPHGGNIASLPTKPDRTGYDFVKWTMDADGLDDEFTTATPITESITVYAQWTIKSIVPPDTLTKTSGSVAKTYIPGTSTNYTISFTLPSDVDAYKSIRIEDTYDANLSNPAIVSLTVNGSAVTPAPSLDTTVSGKASVTLNSTSFSANDVIALTLSFDVSSAASGTVTNTAKLYITNRDDDEQDPGVGDTEEIGIAKYTVTFNSQGGNTVSPITNIPHGGNIGTLPTNPSRTGYDFVKWTMNSNGTGGDFTASTPVTGNITVYAQWTAKAIVPPDALTKISGSATKTYTPGTSTSYTISFTLPSNVEAYKSIRIEDTYGANLSNPAIVSLTVNGNAVTPAPSIDTTSGKASVTLNSTSFSANDVIALTLSFDVSPTASGTVTNTAKLYITNRDNDEQDPGIGDTEETTIVKYTVTYDGNGNTGGTVPVDTNSPYNHGAQAITLGNTQSLVKTGYTFGGWNTQANGFGTDFAAGSTFSVTADTILYAKWMPETGAYTVTFHSNYGIDSTATRTVIAPNTTVGAVNMPSFARSGYSFTGWNTQLNGNGSAFYGNTPVTADIHVYAQWSLNDDDDDDDGGGGGGGGPTIPTPTPPSIPTPPPTPTPTPTPIPTPTPDPTPDPGPAPDPDPAPGDSGTTNPASTPEGRGTTDSTPTPAPRNEPAQASVTPELPNREEALIKDEPTSALDAGRWVGDEDTPRISIGGLEIPLFAPFGVGVWALFNLIMSVLGGIAALAIAIRALLKKKREQDDAENPEEDDKEQKRTRLVWLATTIIMGIAGIFVFLLTENMSNPMVLVDMWTIVNAVILAVEIVAIIFVFKKAKDDDKQNKGRTTDKQNEYISAK